MLLPVRLLISRGVVRVTLLLAAVVALSVVLVSYLAFGAEALTLRVLVAEFAVALVVALLLGLLRAHRG